MTAMPTTVLAPRANVFPAKPYRRKGSEFVLSAGERCCAKGHLFLRFNVRSTVARLFESLRKREHKQMDVATKGNISRWMWRNGWSRLLKK
jgi:hypothetical protein